MDNGTQKEHSIIAKQCWLILDNHFPSITRIFHPHVREIQQELLNN